MSGDTPNLSTNLYFQLNDSVYSKQGPAQNQEEDICIGSLIDFAAKYPLIAGKYYNKQAGKRQDGTVAMNTMFAQDGFVLYVPKGKVLEKPVQLINYMVSETDLMVNRRILIILEENTEAKLLVCDHALNDANYLINQVAEIFIAENARFDYYELEENTRKTNKVSSPFLNQKANSNAVVNGVSLTNGVSRNNIFVTYKCEGADTHLSGIVIADAIQKVDNITIIDHPVHP